MSEWNNYSLGGLAEITSSKRIFYSEYVDSGIPFYRSKEVINLFKKEPVQTELFITHERFNEIESKFGVPNENDILLTSVGSLGIPYLVKASDKFYFKDGNLTWFRNIDKSLLDPKYLYIWLSSSIGKQKLDEVTIGSTQAALTISGLKTIEIELPSLPEQKAIASVLSSLDDKIDLLHRQNNTLEAMAETLFRQWFIEDAKEDWVQATLKDEFAFTMGQSPSGSSFNEDGVGTPMFQGNADFGFRFPKERVYTTEPSRFAKPFDTLISVRAPVGAQNMARFECCIGRGVAAFRHSKYPEWYTYTYYKLNHLMDQIKQFNDEGTVFGSISKSDFEKLEVTIPTDDAISAFEEIAKPLNDKLIANTFQIESLEQLRDTLLPKLMNGEVRVQYQTEEVA